MKDNNFTERKTLLTGEIREYPCTAMDVSPEEVVILYRLPKEGKVEYLILPAGTLSLGYFWTDRPYNAYHWITPSGHTLGLYLNVSDSTKITDTRVDWRDLILDILITPDARCRVWDEHEFADDADPELCRRAEQVRDELVLTSTTILKEIESRSANIVRTIQDGPSSVNGKTGK